MKTKNMTSRIISMILLLTLCLTFYSCGKSEESVPESATLVLRSILEYPNKDLYNPSAVTIGLDTENEDIDYESMEKETDADMETWRDTVGDCFAGKMFDSFYQQWDRTAVLGYAYANNLTIEVSKMQIISHNDNIYHIQTVIDVTDDNSQTEKYELEWRIIFDKDTSDLIQSVELSDDGRFL